jgi:hypothetical protein
LRQAAGIAGLLVNQPRPPEERDAREHHDDAPRQQEDGVPEDIDRIAQLLREHVVHDVDADVLVLEHRPRRAQQEDDAEQHPLQFEPGIGRGVEGLADNRIDRRDDNRGEDQPGDMPADPGIQAVDDARQRKQRVQNSLDGAQATPPMTAGAQPPVLVFLYVPTAWLPKPTHLSSDGWPPPSMGKLSGSGETAAGTGL